GGALTRDLCEPDGQLGSLRARCEAFGDRLQRVQRRLRVAGGEEVRDSFGGLPAGAPGLSGPPLEILAGLPTARVQAPEQEAAKEGVVAVPLSGAAERLEEEPAPSRLCEEIAGVLAAGDRRCQLRVDALGHRRGQEEILELRRLFGEDLLGQVREDLPPLR